MLIAEILLILFFVAVIVAGHEFGHFLGAKMSGMQVNEFGFGYRPRIFSKKIKGTIYSLNALPFGGFVEIEQGKFGEPGRGFNNAPFGKRLLTLFGGIIMNFLIAWTAFSVLFMVGIPQALYITSVLPNSPAQSAGLKSGDQVLGFSNLDTFLGIIKDHEGQPLAFEVARDSEIIKVSVTPTAPVSAETGRIGAEVTESGISRSGFFESIGRGFQSCFKIIGLIFERLASFFKIRGSLSNVSGVVGVIGAIHTANKLGLTYVLELLGMVSLNFTVVNLLPIPALDGGNIAFLIYEKIRGKPAATKITSTVNLAGYLVLLFLMIVVNIRDISKLFLR
ncbi:MAG: site-2 protease family protein [Patescibacteria group bacterium]|nr:site-2 protease family protein [Patescibacteria group bacterium]MCL5261906.1 site-2 protease family protein [Patescibacteria group bacterium]